MYDFVAQSPAALAHVGDYWDEASWWEVCQDRECWQSLEADFVFQHRAPPSGTQLAIEAFQPHEECLPRMQDFILGEELIPQV